MTLTPWARRRLSDTERAVIDATAPSGCDVNIGYSHGWVCRLVLRGVVIGEAYQETAPMPAFRAALADMERKGKSS